MTYSKSFVFRGRGLVVPALALIALLPLQGTPRAQSFDPPAAHAVYVDPIHGSDINAAGSPESPYATIHKGVRAAWQSIQTDVRANEEALLYFDAAVQWAAGLESLPITTGSAVMVVDHGDLIMPYPDALIYLRLESLGFKVTLITDNRVPQGHFTAEMAEAYDLLVITESAGTGNVDPLIEVGIPVINMRGSSWSNWRMSAAPGLSQSVGTQLTVIDGTSPLAAETTGTVTIYNGDWLLNHTAISSLPAGANPVATLAGEADQVCLFSIDAGTSLTAGTAPARRVGFFLFARPRSVDGIDYVFMQENLELNPEIIVAEGTIPIEEDQLLRNRMRVRGGWDSAFQEQDPDKYVSTLDGQNKTHIFEFGTARSANCQVEGITFINGWREDPSRGGGAIYMDPDGYRMWDIVIHKCTFINNHAAFEGGAIYVEDWNLRAVITECKFIGNTAPKGLVIAASQDNMLTIERCLFTDNIATTGGRSVVYFPDSNARSARIINCVFANNQTSGTTSSIIELNGAGLEFQRHHLYNNTFFNNFASGEIIFDNNTSTNFPFSHISINNNLFVNNTCTGEQSRPVFQRQIADSISNSIQLDNNLVYGNTNYEVHNPVGNMPLIRVGVNAIDGNPYLYNPAAGDYRLFEGSAAIDAGVNLAGDLQTDYAGSPRPHGLGYDIGAFEFTGDLRNRAKYWEVYR